MDAEPRKATCASTGLVMPRAAWLIFLATMAAADADTPSLRVLLQKDGQVTMTPKVKIGEPFTVLVTVTPRPGVTVALPTAFDVAPFEVSERREVPATAGERTFALTVVAWEAGDLTLPAIPVKYFVGGDAREVKTEPVTVSVQPTIVDKDAELRPIAGPVTVRVRDLTLVWIGAAVLGVVVLLVMAGFLWGRRRRRAPRVAPAAVDNRTAEEIALARLRELADSGLIDADDRRPFYFTLTDIVRDYLGRRFGFDARELTSEELLARLDGQPISADVDKWLFACDLVKFARAQASRDEAALELEQAVTIVDRCRPPPPRPREVSVAA